MNLFMEINNLFVTIFLNKRNKTIFFVLLKTNNFSLVEEASIVIMGAFLDKSF